MEVFICADCLVSSRCYFLTPRIIYESFFLVKLGQALAYTSLDEKDIQVLVGHLQDFLKYLIKADVFNTADYNTTPPDYHRKAM